MAAGVSYGGAVRYQLDNGVPTTHLWSDSGRFPCGPEVDGVNTCNALSDGDCTQPRTCMNLGARLDVPACIPSWLDAGLPE